MDPFYQIIENLSMYWNIKLLVNNQSEDGKIPFEYSINTNFTPIANEGIDMESVSCFQRLDYIVWLRNSFLK